MIQIDFRSIHILRRFGNMTASSTSEALVSGQAYVEPSSQAQRSVVSSSTQDSSGGSGAKKIRINYLDSNYVLKTEDVTMNGTTAVNTVALDIRFIEDMQVIQGAAAAGKIDIKTLIGGGGTNIASIGSGTYQSFMCHHYVPAGKKAFVIEWGTTVDDEVSMKLIGQDRPDGTNLVDKIFDLDKLFASNPSPPNRISFCRQFAGEMLLPEKTYVRATVVPNQTTSTVIRAFIILWEQA